MSIKNLKLKKIVESILSVHITVIFYPIKSTRWDLLIGSCGLRQTIIFDVYVLLLSVTNVKRIRVERNSPLYFFLFLSRFFFLRGHYFALALGDTKLTFCLFEVSTLRQCISRTHFFIRTPMRR